MFYFIINVFPYSGFFALHLLNTSDTNTTTTTTTKYTAATIGPYAGLLASAFQIGRVTTALQWGKCADIYGRNFVMVVGLISMIVGNVLFGLSTSYRMAVAVRFLAGTLYDILIIALRNVYYVTLRYAIVYCV